LVVAAAWLSEGVTWQKRFLNQYKQLQAADFENRSIALLHPRSKKWDALTRKAVSDYQHNLLSFKELGALVFLPFPEHAPKGSVTASLSLALHELNEIRATGTFLKLSQVRPDFGAIVRTVATEEPHLVSPLLDQAVSWNLIQRYYARFMERFNREQIFEPYLQLEDMSWHPIEEALARIEPSFKFWQQSSYLGILHEGRAISCNVIDAALNFCNNLPLEKRVSHYFQGSLWHELLLGYLKPEAIEQTIAAELQPQLAEEPVIA
jgi:hypothetical protein